MIAGVNPEAIPLSFSMAAVLASGCACLSVSSSCFAGAVASLASDFS
jgi:hypothetical protein